MTGENLRELRAHAAERVRAMRAGEITWEDFIREFGELRDPPIARLVDLIEHEPQRGGPLGIPDSQYQEYLVEVRQAIEELEWAARAV